MSAKASLPTAELDRSAKLLPMKYIPALSIITATPTPRKAEDPIKGFKLLNKVAVPREIWTSCIASVSMRCV
jgi:hypothetical protein